MEKKNASGNDAAEKKKTASRDLCMRESVVVFKESLPFSIPKCKIRNSFLFITIIIFINIIGGPGWYWKKELN